VTIFVGIEQAIATIERLGLHVRDHGLLASALARPSASMFGEDAYATLELKAAALFSSLAQNHPLFDGNNRFALILAFSFLEINGRAMTSTNDEVFDLVLDVAQSRLELDEIAARIAARTVPRPR
jgi:death-on-curing protein